MPYAPHVVKVVVGLLAAAVGYGFATSANAVWPLLVGGLVLAIGLALAVHGLFTGIETAVAAGEDGTATPSE